MEHSKALHQLAEAADLIKMLEDLTNPTVVQQLSPATWSGMRVTLRAVRDAISSSHTVLAHDFISRSRAQLEARVNSQQESQSAESEGMSTNGGLASTASAAAAQSMNKEGFSAAAALMGSDAARIRMARKDLRTAIEKTVDR